LIQQPNNLSLIKKYFYFFFLTSITFVLLIYKAINTEITTDEAYTFLNYSYTNDYFNIGLANNHILNSFLVSKFAAINTTVLFIRLPNLICGFLYVFFVMRFSLHKQYYLLLSLPFVLNPYLIDYFTLSRGYGISSFLIFLACYFYLKPGVGDFVKPILLLSLSTLSIHTTILFLIPFCLLHLNEMRVKYSKMVLFIGSSFLSILTIFNIYILFNITEESKPLYGVESLSLLDVLLGSFGLNGLYGNKNLLFNLMLNVLFISPIIFYKKLDIKHKKILIISYSSIILMFLIPLFLSKPFPLLRTVLPFLPPFLIVITEVLNILKKEHVKLNLNMLFVPLAFVFLFNFTNVIKVNESIDWKDGMSKNTILAIKKDSCEYEVPFQDLDHVGHYYRLINENNHLRLCNEYINDN
jgi:hypothetical protein